MQVFLVKALLTNITFVVAMTYTVSAILVIDVWYFYIIEKPRHDNTLCVDAVVFTLLFF